MSKTLFLVILVVTTLGTAHAELPQYVIRDLGTFGGLEAYGLDVNDAGQVVGYVYHIGGNEAFLWDGEFNSLGSGTANAINNGGQAVGSDKGKGILWDGQRHELAISQARDINDSGDIVGVGTSLKPVLVRNGQVLELAPTAGAALAVNNGGLVAGGYDSQTGLHSNHAFVWYNGSFRDLGTYAGPESYALDVNDAGIVIGWTNVQPVAPSPNFGTAGFLWDGQMRLLAPTFNAQAINSSGWLIGTAVGETQAVLVIGGAALALPGLGGGASRATGISDTGFIVGSAVDPSGYAHAVLWVPVPEPSTILGLLLGLLPVTARARSAAKRRTQRANGCFHSHPSPN